MTDPATLGIAQQDELSAPVSVRLWQGQLDAIDRVANETNRDRAEIMRLLLDRALGRTAA